MTFSSFVISISCCSKTVWTTGLRHDSAFCFVPASNQVCSNPSATCSLWSFILQLNCSQGQFGHHPAGLSICTLPPPAFHLPAPPSLGNITTPISNKNKWLKRAFDFGILFKSQNVPWNLKYTHYDKLDFLMPAMLFDIWVAIGQGLRHQ